MIVASIEIQVKCRVPSITFIIEDALPVHPSSPGPVDDGSPEVLAN